MPWHKLTTPGGTFHCDAPGSNCLSHVLPEEPVFFKAQMKTEMQDEVQDESLVNLTNEVNRLIDEAAQKRSDRNLRIAKTSHGFVILWTHKGPSTALDSPELSDDEMSEVFGLV
ncbi:hypothetical protein [Candidatus Nitrosocosmicus sp. R]